MDHLLFIYLVIILVSRITTINSMKLTPESPEIWLSALSEIDSFHEVSAEPDFRRQPNFQNRFISKNGTDYVVNVRTNYAIFTCKSKYPVRWTFPNHQQMEWNFYAFETSSKRTSNFFPNQTQPSNEYFESSIAIRFSTLTFLCANLTCVTTTATGVTQTPQLQQSSSISSIYIYFSYNQLIERRNETIEVYVPPKKELDTSGEDTVIFPCRAANPNVTVTLEKQMKSKSSIKKWKKFKAPTKFVDFDPKIGFKLLKDTVGKRDLIFGLYRCTAFKDNPQGQDNKQKRVSHFVYINVTSIPPAKPKLDDSSKPFHELKDNASVIYLNGQAFGNHPFKNFTKLYESEMLCCTGISGILPETFVERCNNPLQCELLKVDMIGKIRKGYKWINPVEAKLITYKNDRNDCSRTLIRSGAVISCNQKSIQFLEHFMPLFEKDLFSVENRMKAEGQNFKSITKYETEAKIKFAGISEKIFLTIGYPVTSKQLLLKGHHNPYEGITFRRSKDYFEDGRDVSPYHQFQSASEHLSHHSENLRKRRRKEEQSFSKVAEYPRDHFYEGEPLVIVCLGWRHLYQDGAQLRILWRNGSRSIVEQPEIFRDKETSKTFYFSGQVTVNGGDVEDNHLISMFGREMKADKNMMSVECWMPILDTSGWNKITRNLTVLVPVPPKFVGVDGNVTEETVYLYLGEEQGRYIEWQVVGGAPEPWTYMDRDGNDLLDINSPLFVRYSPHNFSMGIFNLTIIPPKVEAIVKNNDSGINPNSKTVPWSVVITFAKVSPEMQGTYLYSAENTGGKVIRTFKVIVTEKRNILMPILLTMTIILVSLLLLIGMGVIYWRQQGNLELDKK